jgi:chitodextrinase
VNQEGSGTITVTGLTASTPYTFTVTATNAAGTSGPSNASASVTTSSPPGAPTIGAATATGVTATVAFTAPATNGGSAITKYTVTSNPGGKTGTVNQEGSGTVTVSGLNAITAYTFTVTATNAAGTSVSSNASASVMTTYGVRSTGPGGGSVFYVATTPFLCGPTLSSTCTYLESAPASGAGTWCSNTSKSITGASDTAIGSGYKNTMAMVNGGCTTGAAVVARSNTSGGLSDWYLPSKDELKTMVAENRARSYPDEVFYYGDYWSSSQLDAATAWFQHGAGNEAPLAKGKGLSYNVRAIRAF